MRSLNRFKTDPRVKTGPRFDSREAWVIFSFGAELQRSRRHWFVFHAPSRFYAVEAASAREAKRIVDQYRLIRVPQFLCSYQVASGDNPGVSGADSARLLNEARRGLLRVFKRATIRREIVTPLFQTPMRPI